MYAVVWAIDQDKIAYWAGGNHFSEEVEDAVRFPNKTLAEDTIPLIYPRGMHNPGAFVTELRITEMPTGSNAITHGERQR